MFMVFAASVDDKMIKFLQIEISSGINHQECGKNPHFLFSFFKAPLSIIEMSEVRKKGGVVAALFLLPERRGHSVSC